MMWSKLYFSFRLSHDVVILSYLTLAIYLSSTDCESLIRRILSVDPAKRFSVAQIKQHRWMQADNSAISQSLSFSSCLEAKETYNEAVLRIMQTVGIDRKRTIEVRSPEIKLC